MSVNTVQKSRYYTDEELEEQKDLFGDEDPITSEFDEHLGCANWPMCCEVGCGYSNDVPGHRD